MAVAAVQDTAPAPPAREPPGSRERSGETGAQPVPSARFHGPSGRARHQTSADAEVPPADGLGVLLRNAVLARRAADDDDEPADAGEAEVVDPSTMRPIDDLSTEDAEECGQDALATVGYDELMRLAVDAGFLASDGEVGDWPQAPLLQCAVAGRVLARQAAEAVTFGAVFTRYAVAAGIASQLDSPAPGPGDVVALGILAVGLVVAGYAVLSRPCPPCPANPAPEIDRVPPSAPHWPCSGDHWHYRVYNQNPSTCQCFLSGRLFGGCCGLPGAPC